MLNFFRTRTLKESLEQTKKVKVQGVLFKIKKLSPLSYLEGHQVIQTEYTTYDKARSAEKSQLTVKMLRDNYRSIMLGGVVSPKLTAKKNADESEGIFVDELFDNISLVTQLCEEITYFSYGKKKIQQMMLNASRDQDS